MLLKQRFSTRNLNEWTVVVLYFRENRFNRPPGAFTKGIFSIAIPTPQVAASKTNKDAGEAYPGRLALDRVEYFVDKETGVGHGQSRQATGVWTEGKGMEKWDDPLVFPIDPTCGILPRLTKASREWRNWQTRQLEVLVGVKSRGGSSPLSRISGPAGSLRGLVFPPPASIT